MAMPLAAIGMGTAHADKSVRVRVGGSVSVNVRTKKRHKRVKVRVKRRHRSHAHYRLRIGGSVSFGASYGHYSEPPPPPSYDCEPDPIPAYYTPAPPAPPVVTTVVGTAYQPELPRWGVGVYAGNVDVEDRPYGSDIGLLGRLRLNNSGSLNLEGEIAKTEHEDGARVDKRMGVSLLWDLSPRSRLSPYLLAGAGMAKVDVDGWNADQDYGEVGAGLTFKVTERLHLAGDLRAGARTAVDSSPAGAMKSIAPSAEESESYTRGRISAVLFF